MPRQLRVLLTGLAFLLPPAPAEAGPLRIGLGVEWLRAGVSSSVAGYVQLEVPLERLAAPPPRVLGEGRQLVAEAPRTESAPIESTRAEAAQREPETTARAAGDAPAPPPAREKAVVPLAPGAVRDLVRAALRSSGAASTNARLDGLSARARASAALPELVLRAARSTDQSLRLAPSDARTLEVTQTGGADLLLEARASWRLDRLLFADEELRVEALRIDRARARERLVALVLERLFAWQRARARLASDELEPEVRLGLELELEEARLALDVLTAGAFSAREAPAQTRVPARAAAGAAVP